ncbi:MAG: ATP-dependent DNA helicase [Actinobacteria bacterium]|nr:ATP-dependent DNA helicase [Actinomycetota bacterium]
MPDKTAADRAEAELEHVTAAMAQGEVREGQVEMTRAVAAAIEDERHLVVQAGTGVGKTFAYLVPAVLSGQRVVVATTTKTLQDQLATKDLPFLADHGSVPFTFAVLKGRSNYLCLQRAHEVLREDGDQLVLEGVGTSRLAQEVIQLVEWATTATSGDRAELAFEPAVRAWSAVSVGPNECPGANRCPVGDACFAERARRKAAESDVVIVNTHLYGTHLATGGMVLPDHRVVVFDEAHALEEVISSTAGLTLTAGRFAAVARLVTSATGKPEDGTGIGRAGEVVGAAMKEWVGRRIRSMANAPELADAISDARIRLDAAPAAMPSSGDDNGDGDGDREDAARRLRATKALDALIGDLDRLFALRPADVLWVEGTEESPVLRVAPIDVGEVLGEQLWDFKTAILTSATIPPALAERVGMVPDSYREVNATSPFDYETNALLYCAAHLPDPRAADFEEQALGELVQLIEAAGGRTLALFTSHRAMQAAAAYLRGEVMTEILVQDDLPRQALISRFASEHESSLVATMGFWQGIDVPGPSLALVTIDKLPFPRPDEPLLQARREQARGQAFDTVDLPRACTLLAQGAGRLIRTRSDRGVVAVLDRRLATQASYRWKIIQSLPPMRRTRDRDEAVAFLEALRDGAATTGSMVSGSSVGEECR